jgi:tetratricopeptide (TPR) repeat protein
MSHRLYLLLIFMTILLGTGLAPTSRADGLDDAFNAGLKLYQAAQYDQACEQFQTALRQQPSNKYILYNSWFEVWLISFSKVSAPVAGCLVAV